MSYEETRAVLLELSSKDAYNMHNLWRNKVKQEIGVLLVDYMFEGITSFDFTVNAALKWVEETGCSVETAVMKAVNLI